MDDPLTGLREKEANFHEGFRRYMREREEEQDPEENEHPLVTERRGRAVLSFGWGFLEHKRRELWSTYCEVAWEDLATDVY